MVRRILFKLRGRIINIPIDTELISRTLIVFLFLAVLPLPYGYYMLLRVIILVGSILLLTNKNEIKNRVTIIIMMVIYNPIFPIHLNKTIWTIINVATICYIFKLKSIESLNEPTIFNKEKEKK